MAGGPTGGLRPVALDAQVPVQHERQRAVELAYGAIARRERTVAELRAYLERKRVGPASIDSAVEELVSTGYLDDAGYARRFADDRRRLDSWGCERIERDLRRRGVEPALVEAALATRGRADEIHAAVELLARRLAAPPRDARERGRAWSLLVRRGYDPEVAYDAVREHERAGGPTGRAA